MIIKYGPTTKKTKLKFTLGDITLDKGLPVTLVFKNDDTLDHIAIYIDKPDSVCFAVPFSLEIKKKIEAMNQFNKELYNASKRHIIETEEIRTRMGLAPDYGPMKELEALYPEFQKGR